MVARTGSTPAFDVAKVRVSFRGTMFRPWVRYNFAFEAGRTSGESSNKIKDAYLELGKDLVAVRAGQYKVPFGLQEQAPDTGQEFVDRSLANAAFAPSRDAGVMLTGTGRGKKLGYAIGVFNGSGESKVQNNRALMWAARLWADPLGEYKLAESAVEAQPKGSLHVGLAVRGCDAMKGGKSGVVQDVNRQTAVGLELAWKWQRVFLTGEGFWQRGRGPQPDARTRRRLGRLARPGRVHAPRSGASSWPPATPRWTPTATTRQTGRRSCAARSTTTGRRTT